MENYIKQNKVKINKKYTISLTLGCLIANIFSGMALDCLFGTLGTLTTCLLMCIIKNKYISLLASPIMNGLFVGFELAISFDDLEVAFEEDYESWNIISDQI